MTKLWNFVGDLYSYFTIYRILTIERLQQKYQHKVDPVIHKPKIREDLSTYVNSLRPEFDYSAHFHKKRGYYPILFMRRAREDTRLSDWMNKIWINEHLENLGVPTLKRYYASYEAGPSEELLDSLTLYVAKPAHLSEGDSVFIVADGIDLKSGQDVNAKLVSIQLADAMFSKTVSWDPWGTRNSKAGVVVEEMSANGDGELSSMPDEVKIYCIWGRVYFGVWRRGNVYQKSSFLYRDYPNESLQPTDLVWWKTMIEVAEVVASGTDLLRVDMFINGGQPVVSEVEIMPATPVPQALQTEMAKLLNTGYIYHKPK